MNTARPDVEDRPILLSHDPERFRRAAMTAAAAGDLMRIALQGGEIAWSKVLAPLRPDERERARSLVAAWVTYLCDSPGPRPWEERLARLAGLRPPLPAWEDTGLFDVTANRMMRRVAGSPGPGEYVFDPVTARYGFHPDDADHDHVPLDGGPRRIASP